MSVFREITVPHRQLQVHRAIMYLNMPLCNIQEGAIRIVISSISGIDKAPMYSIDVSASLKNVFPKYPFLLETGLLKHSS